MLCPSVLLVTVGFAALAHGLATDTLWPLPASIQWTDDRTLIFDKNLLEFETVGAQSPVLDEAYVRYKDLYFPISSSRRAPTFSAATTLVKIQVDVASSDDTLAFGVDESYTLHLNDGDTSTISAATVWGALHALETIAQLIRGISEEESYVYSIPITVIDAPRFPHRGLLVDSSRNFLSKEALFRSIDGLAASKMNVLHWHMTDSQSFPYHVPAFDRLSDGAYSYKEVYLPSDVAEVVHYGYLRGVRVMPEFDSPGHANAGFAEYPNVTVCANAVPYIQYCLQPPCGQLNPSTPLTYDILDGLLSQAANDFGDDFVHLGFDEVNENCFMSDAGLVEWMAGNGLSTIEDLLQYHADKLVQITNRLQRTPVFWQEAFDHGLTLPSSSVLQIWNAPASLVPILQAGYRALLSNYEAWYLDCGHGSWLTGGDDNWCEYNGWKTVYLNEPVPDIIADQPDLVELLIGGEVCSWGESVDSVSLDNRVWPRAAAAGERLWSAKEVRDVDDAMIRLEHHRNRLVARGIAAAALRPKWCEHNPEFCDVNTDMKSAHKF